MNKRNFQRRVLFAFLISTAVFIVANLFFYCWRLESVKPRTLTFELPFPKDVEKKSMITPETIVEKVIVAGFFSEWSPTNTNYLMKQVSATRWQTSLALDPGENQYKFVVYLSNSCYSVVWTHDKAARKQTDDRHGGYNSIIDIVDPVPLWTLFNWIFGTWIILIAAINLYFLFDYLKRMKRNLLFPISVVLSCVLIVLICCVTFSISIAGLKMKVWDLFYNSITGVRAVSESRNIALDHPDWPEVRTGMVDIFKQYLWGEQEILRKQYFQNSIPFVGLVLFQKDLSDIDIGYRADDDSYEEWLSDREGRVRIEDTMMSEYFRHLVRRIHEAGITMRNYRLQNTMPLYLQDKWNFDIRHSGLMYSVQTIFPIVENGEISAWIGSDVRVPWFRECGPGILFLLFMMILLLGAANIWLFFILKRDNTVPVNSNGRLSEKILLDFHITGREKDIIRMIFEGLSTKEISARLFISPKTVDSHIYKIYQKTGVKNRIELYNLLKE